MYPSSIVRKNNIIGNIMKNINSFRLIVIVAFIMIFICSCSSDKDEPNQDVSSLPILIIDKTVYEISGEAQMLVISFKSNDVPIDLQIMGASWINQISTRSIDVEDRTISLNIDLNSGNETRNGLLTIFAGNKPNRLSKVISVRQAPLK